MTQKELNAEIYAAMLQYCRDAFRFATAKEGIYTLKELAHIKDAKNYKFGLFGYYKQFEDKEITIEAGGFKCSFWLSNVFSIAYKFESLAGMGGKKKATFERTAEEKNALIEGAQALRDSVENETIEAPAVYIEDIDAMAAEPVAIAEPVENLDTIEEPAPAKDAEPVAIDAPVYIKASDLSTRGSAPSLEALAEYAKELLFWNVCEFVPAKIYSFKNKKECLEVFNGNGFIPSFVVTHERGRYRLALVPTEARKMAESVNAAQNAQPVENLDTIEEPETIAQDAQPVAAAEPVAEPDTIAQALARLADLAPDLEPVEAVEDAQPVAEPDTIAQDAEPVAAVDTVAEPETIAQALAVIAQPVATVEDAQPVARCAGHLFRLAYRIAAVAAVVLLCVLIRFNASEHTTAQPVKISETVAEPDTIAQEPEPLAAVEDADTIAQPVETVAELDTIAQEPEPVAEAEPVAEPDTIAQDPEPLAAVEDADTIAQPVETLAEPDTIAEPETVAAVEDVDTIAQPVEIMAEPDTIAQEPEPLATVEDADTIAQPVEILAESDTIAQEPEPLATVEDADTIAQPAETLAEPDSLAHELEPLAPVEDVEPVAEPAELTTEDTEPMPPAAAALSFLLFPFVMGRVKNEGTASPCPAVTPAPTFADVLAVARQYIAAKAEQIRTTARQYAAQLWARYGETFQGVALMAAGVYILYLCALLQSARM